MHWQLRYLEETKRFSGLTGVDIVDLPNSGMLGGIEMRIWGTCGAGNDKPDVWLHDRLTKIEVIVNGSQVVKSYSGEQLLGIMFHKNTPIWSHDIKNMASASCEEAFFINFGLIYHDLEHQLNLGRVTDPELRFTYNFAATGAHGWTNGAAMTTAPDRSIICHLLKDGPADPTGYIKTSELYRFTSSASLKENMRIPRGPTFSNLYLQSWYKQQGLGAILDKVELNLNMSESIPIRIGPNELAAQNLRQYGLCRIAQQFSAKGGQVYPCPIEQGVLNTPRIIAVDLVASGIDLWANYGSINFKLKTTGTGSAASNNNVQCVFEGIWPFSIAALPYFNPLDPRTYLDTSRYGDVNVRVEETATGASPAIVKLLGDELVKTYL